ncbi:hypothetical protein Mapa_013497 [Marchantia paleacea]|nr:hypothetical protein Mapa_013497 [Marchantia paleacea]
MIASQVREVLVPPRQPTGLCVAGPSASVDPQRHYTQRTRQTSCCSTLVANTWIPWMARRRADSRLSLRLRSTSTASLTRPPARTGMILRASSFDMLLRTWSPRSSLSTMSLHSVELIWKVSPVREF